MSEEVFGIKARSLDKIIKKKPKEDPVGLFLDEFGGDLDVERVVSDKIDFSYLSPAQKAESMWALFQIVKKSTIKRAGKDVHEEMGKDEMNELQMSLEAIKKLYEDDEVKRIYLNNHRRHMRESELINGDFEQFKIMRRTVLHKEEALDKYSRRIFGKRGKINEIDRLLFKTAKNKLYESRNKLEELLASNAELRALNQFENIKAYAGQLRKEGYIWLPSRRKFLEDFEEAVIFGRPLLIFGESGTGKTELIKSASIKLTGQIAAETAGKDTRLQDLVARRDISGDKTFYRYGEIGRAATGMVTTLDTERKDDGRIIIDDEFNLLPQAEQLERLSRIASWKPGKKVMLPQVNEEVEIAPNFLYCASVNLASSKYGGGRSDIPLEVMRRFHKTEVGFLTREEIYDAMQAAFLDENNRMRAAKTEIGPVFYKKEESRTVIKDGQEVKQNLEKWELKEHEEKGGRSIMAGGFVWRLSGAIDELNKSIAHRETVLRSKGEGQYLNKILIDIGRITEWIKKYIVSEDKMSIEQFIVEQIRNQFSEIGSFSEEDRELTKEFFAYYGIDLTSDAEKTISDFEIMTPRDIGLLSPRVKYEKVVKEEPFITESFYITPEGKRVIYRIEKFGQGASERMPGQIYLDTNNNAAIKFLGVNKETGGPVYEPFKRGVKKAETYKKEVFSPIAKANWKNPETQKEQEIKIDFGKSLAEQKVFYENKLNLKINEAKAKAIWEKNYTEIKSEIEKYGYDTILIVPDNLPEVEVLNRDLIESMEETVGSGKKKAAATHQGDNFEQGGLFAGVRNSEQPKYRIVLTHSDQNIYNNPAANPYLKATLSKNIMQLSGLDLAEIKRRIAGNQEIKVDFKAMINGQEIRIQSDGGSLEEYILQQAMYFEKTGKHLDEDDWTWLLKARSGSRVVVAHWYPGARRLYVDAYDALSRSDILGLRLSRSFSS